MKVGDAVRIKGTTQDGQLTRRKIGDDDQMLFLMEWKLENGEHHERWFTEDQLDVTGQAVEDGNAQ